MAWFQLNVVSFCCMEQFLACERAVVSGDWKMQRRVLASMDPTEQRRFLILIKEDGLETAWREKVQGIATRGAMAKFHQNLTLKDFLLSTGDKRIGEASPDPFWRICGEYIPIQWRICLFSNSVVT